MAALLLITSAASAQPDPYAGQPPPPPQGQMQEPAQQQMPQQQQQQQAPHMRMRDRFEAANTTHDGRLTVDQAQAANWRGLVRNFSQIDVDHKGYVTVQDIRSWGQARRQARAAQMPPPPPQQ